MSVTVGCDTVLTVDTKLPPSCNFLVSESFKIAIEVYNRWRISLKRLLNKQINKRDIHTQCSFAGSDLKKKAKSYLTTARLRHDSDNDDETRHRQRLQQRPKSVNQHETEQIEDYYLTEGRYSSSSGTATSVSGRNGLTSPEIARERERERDPNNKDVGFLEFFKFQWRKVPEPSSLKHIPEKEFCLKHTRKGTPGKWLNLTLKIEGDSLTFFLVIDVLPVLVRG
ncbi:hypothetical protein YC2023_030608 [Brassica napus]